MCNNNAAICDVMPSVGGNASFINEEDCVGAGYLAGYALGEAANFFGVRLAVELLVLGLFMRCWYSMSSPVSVSRTALSISARTQCGVRDWGENLRQ